MRLVSLIIVSILWATACLADGMSFPPSSGGGGGGGPAISGVTATPGTGASYNTAAIAWTASLTATSGQVCYGTSANPYPTCASSVAQSGPGAASLTGLAGSTLYHYQVALTYSGYTVTSSDATFTTNAAPAAPVAMIILGDGQSLMQGPVAGNNQLQGAISGGVLTVNSGSYANGPVGVGSQIGCAGCGQGVTITKLNGTAGCGSTCTGSPSSPAAGQTYGLSNTSLTANGGVVQTIFLVPASFISTFSALTTSPQYTNAYMISLASGILSSRAIMDANAVADATSANPNGAVSSADWPMDPSKLTGFTGLREAAAMSNIAASPSLFNLESPVSAAVYQFIQEASIPTTVPVIAANVARGAAGYVWASCAPWGGPVIFNCIGPGSSWWYDKRAIQAYIKETVQYGMNGANPLANNPGYWPTQLAGVLWRHGEVVASGNNATAAASFTTSSTSITTTANNSTGQPGHPGDAIWDNTAGCFVGYIHDWATNSAVINLAALNSDNTPNLASTGTSKCASSGSSDALWFAEAHYYVNELLDLETQYNNFFDTSDTPFSFGGSGPSGVPIVALQFSTMAFQQAAIWTPPTAFAFEDAALANRNVVLAGPNFMCEFQSDGIHNTSRGNALCGAYMGEWLAQWRLGTRTPPFAMTQAQFLTPAAGDGTHYIIRVTFQMSPFSNTLQFYGNGISGTGSSDTNFPAVTNYGFQYTDGALAGRKSSLFKCSQAGSKSITAVQLATSTAGHPGAANQIDLVMSGDASGATNPTVCLGGAFPGNLTWWGTANVQSFSHNVADKSCRLITDTAIRGNAFFNAPCGTSTADYLINFASRSAVNVGAAALTPAW